MKKLRIYLAIFATAHLFAHPTLSTSYNDSAFALFSTLDNEENMVISPLSINSCLYMVYMGAEGATADAMAQALAITMPKEEVPAAFDALFTSLSDVRIANGIWISDHFTILPAYYSLVANQFHGKVARLSFGNPEQAAATINGWVASQTEDAITNLFGRNDLNRNTRLVLVNATYFEGSWRSPFTERNTCEAPFYTLDNGSVDTQMMHQQSRFPYFANDEAQFIALPLNVEGNIAMVIYLPKHDLFELTSDALLDALDSLKPHHVNLFLPKFTTRYRTSLVDAFKALSMGIAFTPSADFSGIDGRQGLSISKIVHEALFECDEKGIVAAAATGVAMGVTASLPPRPTITFRANRPFLYFLMDMDSKTVLFMGKLSSP